MVTSREIELPRHQQGQIQRQLSVAAWPNPWLTPTLIKCCSRCQARHQARRSSLPRLCRGQLRNLGRDGHAGRGTFLEAGGESFTLVPCINDNDLWVDGLAALCLQQADALES